MQTRPYLRGRGDLRHSSAPLPTEQLQAIQDAEARGDICFVTGAGYNPLKETCLRQTECGVTLCSTNPLRLRTISGRIYATSRLSPQSISLDKGEVKKENECPKLRFTVIRQATTSASLSGLIVSRVF
jgi:hypothetical protein